MSQMIYGVRLNPDRVPQSIIDKVAGEEARAAVNRTRREEAKRREALQARAQIVERNRNRMLTACAHDMDRRVERMLNPAARSTRIMRRIANAYVMTAATIMCIPEIGENLGLWIDERKEGNK